MDLSGWHRALCVLALTALGSANTLYEYVVYHHAVGDATQGVHTPSCSVGFAFGSFRGYCSGPSVAFSSPSRRNMIATMSGIWLAKSCDSDGSATTSNKSTLLPGRLLQLAPLGDGDGGDGDGGCLPPSHSASKWPSSAPRLQ